MAVPSLIVPFLSSPIAIRGARFINGPSSPGELIRRSVLLHAAFAAGQGLCGWIPTSHYFTATLMLLRLLSGIALAASERCHIQQRGDGRLRSC